MCILIITYYSGELGFTRATLYPSTYQQCLQTVWRGKKLHLNALDTPFQKIEALFSESIFFNELAEYVEVAPARPRGITLPKWEAYEKQTENFDEKASTFTNPKQFLEIVEAQWEKKGPQQKEALWKDKTGWRTNSLYLMTVYGPNPSLGYGPHEHKCIKVMKRRL